MFIGLVRLCAGVFWIHDSECVICMSDNEYKVYDYHEY